MIRLLALHWPGPLAQAFLRRALVTGTCIAVASGVLGHFLVIRKQLFAADALSHVSFTGGLAALAFGVDARFGVVAGTVAAAVALALLGGLRQVDDVVTGVLFTLILGLGAFFLSVFTSSRTGGNGAAAVRVLFGSIYGISPSTAAQTAWVALGCTVAVLAIGRPLLFASLDPAVARARGVPVRGLGIAFLVIAAVGIAQVVQVIGALLLLALVSTPAATAQRITADPWRAVGLSAAIGVGTVWGGLAAGYLWPALPPSTAIVAVGFVVYVVTILATRIPSGASPSPTSGDPAWHRRSPPAGRGPASGRAQHHSDQPGLASSAVRRARTSAPTSGSSARLRP